MAAEMASGVHRVGDGTVRFYVLVERADLALVDAGLPSHYDQLTALLEGIGRSVRDARAVLLTHIHPDHVGLAERLRHETGATVWVLARDMPALAHPFRPPGVVGGAQESSASPRKVVATRSRSTSTSEPAQSPRGHHP